MNSKLVAASAIAMAVTLFAIFSLRPRARKLGLVDRPDERKRHNGAIPIVGGLCFFAGTLVGLSYLGYVDRFVGSVMVSAVVIVVAGALDDRHNLDARARLGVEACAAALVIAATGIYVDFLGTIPGLGEVSLGPWIGVPFTIFAVVGLINAFNMLDGIDGLAAAASMASIAAIMLLDQHDGAKPGSLWMMQVLFAALIPYLFVNLGWPDGRKIFMGDAGSMLLGFFLACGLVHLSHRGVQRLAPVDVLWCVALPVIDTIAVAWRRMRAGHSPFQADRSHLHHVLLDAGLGDRMVLAIVVGACGLLAALGYALRDAPDWIGFVAFLMVLAAHVLLTPRLAGWRRGVAAAGTDEAASTDAPPQAAETPVKALCVLSASGDAIRIAPIAAELSKDLRFDATVCVAHADSDDATQVLRLFDVEPDLTLSDAGDAGIDALETIDRLVGSVHPDIVLISGNGPATLPTILAARCHDVPVVCVDAAARESAAAHPADDAASRITRTLASLHLAANESDGRQLLSEGIPAERLVVAGNPSIETLRAALARIDGESELQQRLSAQHPFASGKFPLVLVLARAKGALPWPLLASALQQAATARPRIGFACPSSLFDSLLHERQAMPPNLHLFESPDFLASVFLLERASAVVALDDIAAEAAALGKPVLALDGDGETWPAQLLDFVDRWPASTPPLSTDHEDGSRQRAVEALASLRSAVRHPRQPSRNAGSAANAAGAQVAMDRMS